MRRLRNGLLTAAAALALLPGAAGAASSKITIVNHSGQSLYNLYAGDSGAALSDQLGPDDVIGDGEQRAVTLRTDCTSNLTAVFKDGRTVTVQGVDVCREPKWEFGAYGKNVVTFGIAREASAEPASAGPEWTEHACTFGSDRMVVRVEPHNVVTLSMNGRPVAVRKAENVQPPLDEGYLSIETATAHYELYEGSGEERTVLQRFRPGDGPVPGATGVCSTSYSEAVLKAGQRREAQQRAELRRVDDERRAAAAKIPAVTFGKAMSITPANATQVWDPNDWPTRYTHNKKLRIPGKAGEVVRISMTWTEKAPFVSFSNQTDPIADPDHHERQHSSFAHSGVPETYTLPADGDYVLDIDVDGTIDGDRATFAPITVEVEKVR